MLRDVLGDGAPEAGKAVMVVVVDTQGSAPRKAGARMLVLADGTIRGTVGGGWLEAEATRLAEELLASGGPAFLRRFELRGPGSGTPMICGGAAELLFQPQDEPLTRRS